MDKRQRFLLFALLILTIFDLSLVGRVERVDLEPIRSPSDVSKVLAGLSEGIRTVDSLRNLPMVVGLNPVSSYRTLDLPALEPLTGLASRIPANDAEIAVIAAAIRATGSRVRIFDPFEVMELDRMKIRLPDDPETIDDPTLAGWRFGVDYVKQQGKRMSKFRVWRLPKAGVRGWLVPLTPGRHDTILGEWTGDPATVLSALADARPLAFEQPSPELRVFRIRADGPALVIFTELADPEWQAVWTGVDGERAGVIERAFGRANHGAWEAIRVPGAGEWTLRLIYRGRDVYLGLMLSAVSWLVFGGLFFRFGRIGKLKKEA